MRYLFYHYNSGGYLILEYQDEYGGYIDHCYMYYSLREAIKLFRERYGLRYKHITVQKLF
ncbi:MAG: hypothetical protein OSJ74_03220 [Clostridia bacterium]|nr:hypothetical protein [Clostridia bacterium]